MEYDTLSALLDRMASDILFLDGTEIDIPSVGKFLNQLDEIIKEAETLNISQINDVARGMAGHLEKIILGANEGEEWGLASLVKGTSLMQEIVDSYKATGEYHADMGSFRNPGIPSAEAPVDTPSATDEREGTQAEKFQIQDESLLKDFIVEGLEYIEEIEVNILNLENNPGDKDYINAIFRPFHSIKGVASFLNLENIRDLAHNLENLLDKARNGELQVKPPLIDVVLDGADALKAMIGSLKDEMEGKGRRSVNVDLKALEARIGKVGQGAEIVTQPEKIGEILLKDGIITEDILDEGLKIAQANPEKKSGRP